MNFVRDDGIDVMELLRALWKNILLIALSAVLFGTAAFGYTVFFIKPTYQAKASLYVNNSTFSIGSSNYYISAGELNVAYGLVPTYVYILQSRTTLDNIAKEAGLNYSAGALKGMISAKPVENTSAFEVTVTCGDPADAELIANTVCKVLPDRIAEIVDGSALRIVDYAIIPSHRSAPNHMSNTITGMMAGAVLCAALVVLKTMLDSKTKSIIRSADDLRAMYPEIPVLSVIPDMRQSDKKSSYYSSYYGVSDPVKKGGKKHA